MAPDKPKKAIKAPRRLSTDKLLGKKKSTSPDKLRDVPEGSSSVQPKLNQQERDKAVYWTMAGEKEEHIAAGKEKEDRLRPEASPISEVLSSGDVKEEDPSYETEAKEESEDEPNTSTSVLRKRARGKAQDLPAASKRKRGGGARAADVGRAASKTWAKKAKRKSTHAPGTSGAYDTPPLGLANPIGRNFCWIPPAFLPLFGCTKFRQLVQHLRSTEGVHKDPLVIEVLTYYHAVVQGKATVPTTGEAIAQALQKAGIIDGFNNSQNPLSVAMSVLKYLDKYAPPNDFSRLVQTRFDSQTKCCRCNSVAHQRSNAVVNSWAVTMKPAGRTETPLTVASMYGSTLIEYDTALCRFCASSSEMKTTRYVNHGEILFFEVYCDDAQSRSETKGTLPRVSVEQRFHNPYDRKLSWELVAAVLVHDFSGKPSHSTTLVPVKHRLYHIDEAIVSRIEPGCNLESLKVSGAWRVRLQFAVYESVEASPEEQEALTSFLQSEGAHTSLDKDTVEA